MQSEGEYPAARVASHSLNGIGDEICKHLADVYVVQELAQKRSENGIRGVGCQASFAGRRNARAFGSPPRAALAVVMF